MPVDILPAPTVAPGGAASGASDSPATGPSGRAVSGGALAVFSLLLAQIAQPPSAGAQPGAVQAASPATTGAKSQAAPHTVKGDKSKDDGKVNQGITEALWLPPILAPSPPATPAATATTAGSDKTIPGKVMDTAPPVRGELLSQTQQNPAQTQPVSVQAQPVTAQTRPPVAQTQPPVAQTQPPVAQTQPPVAQTQPVTAQSVTTDVIVPSEPAGPPAPTPAANLPAAFPSLVPVIAAQASQAVILPAASPPAATPAKSPPVATSSGAAARGKSSPATAPGLAPSPATRGRSDAFPPPPLSPAASKSAPDAVATLTLVPSEPSAAAPSAAIVPAATHSPTIPGPVSAPPALQNTGTPADNRTGNTTVTPATPAPSAALTSGKASAEKPGAAARTEQAPITGTALAPPVPAQTLGAAAMPAPDRTRMVAQVADSVRTMAAPAGGGQRQMTVQLHPKDWGRVNVSITMTPTTGADGKVSTQVVAHIVAENPAVKAALDIHRADLRQALHGTGLHLDTLTVTVQASSDGAQAGPGNDRQPGANGGWAGAQPQTGGADAQGGAAFGGSGGGQQSAFAGFAGGDPSGRRPPSPYAATQTHTMGEDSLSPASAPPATGGSMSRVDTRA